MIHYKGFRTSSWNESARYLADNMISSCEWEISQGRDDKDGASNWMCETLQNSYRNFLIVKRAAKRIHRKGWL